MRYFVDVLAAQNTYGYGDYVGTTAVVSALSARTAAAKALKRAQAEREKEVAVGATWDNKPLHYVFTRAIAQRAPLRYSLRHYSARLRNNEPLFAPRDPWRHPELTKKGRP